MRTEVIHEQVMGIVHEEMQGVYHFSIVTN